MTRQERTAAVSRGGALRVLVAAVLAATPLLGAAQAAPVITSLRGPSESVLVGATATFVATAEDPAGGQLGYAWSATSGTIAGNGAEASWTAPATAGTATIRVTVTNANGSTTSSLAVPVVLAGYRGGLGATISAPRRVVADELGNLYAVDATQGAIVLLTRRGDAKGRALLPEPAAALASAPGILYVATGSGRLLTVDPVTGKARGEIALADGPLRAPSALVYEPSRMLLWIAERASGRIRAVRPDGTTAFVLAAARNAPLSSPVDVAVDPVAGRIWVLLEKQPGSATLAAPELGRVLHSFTYDGAWVASIAIGGVSTGQVARAGGLAVDRTGALYVTDVFQGWVQVYATAGTFRGTIGSYGAVPGGLRNPLGAAFLANGDLAVANVGAARVERFGGTADLPACDGDLDCDGLSDAFETANGLNAGSAADALEDPDGDGLSNTEEYALGTSPVLRDSDGDGWTDAEELAAGFDPRDPRDHRVELIASGPVESPPGMIELSASVVNGEGCTVAWTQLGGPEAVTLRGASGSAPSYVARAAGVYSVQARATCGRSVSEPVAVATRVLDVPPRADAGPMRVVRTKSSVLLDADGSSDANADPLTFSWDQLLGAAVAGATPGSTLAVDLPSAGYYVFAVTARDAGGNGASAEAPVLVTTGSSTSTAVASTPVRGNVGTPVALDATASVVTSTTAVFSWSQVDGPPVALDASAGTVAQFTPAAAGRYAFDVWIADGTRLSPPARVDVFVAAEGSQLPTAAIAAVPAAQQVGAPVTLDATASAGASGGVAYAWRQVAGPALGLTDADRAVATAVPFAPGSYEVELTVREGDAVSIPARVRFDAASPSAALPVAVAAGPASAIRGSVVALDASGSTGAVRFQWSQVAGPWVALDGATTAAPTFQPSILGVHTFQLVVESGGVRSAPAYVAVSVVAK